MRRKVEMSLAAVLASALTVLPAGAAHATFPGENGKIAFSARMVDDTSNEIYTINPDGTGLTRLTDAPGDDIEPSWSPDGTKLVFASERDADPCAPGLCAELYSMDAGGTQATRLTTTPGVHESEPAWSPDGTEIAYSSREGGTTSTVVSLMDAAGTNQHTLFTDDQNNRAFAPTWSPEGDRLGFESGGIRVGNRDGSGERFVGNGELPSWSPYHDLILTVVNDFRRELRALSPDDDRSDVVVPVGTALVPSAAVWSPDMDAVAVAVGNAIELRRSDGTQPSTLIATDGLVYGIDWLAIPTSVPGYVRALSASPQRVPLVLAYAECTSPDRVHGPPLESPSCSHPTQSSELLTVGTSAAGQPSRFVGSVRMGVLAGDPTTHADEADVRLKLDVTDVRRKRDLADYGGVLLVPLDIRLTDRYNGCCRVGGPHSATVAEGWLRDGLSFGAPCVATADPDVGAHCSVSTTIEAIAPAVVLEGARSTWQLGQIQVFAGSGEPSPFAVQGLFVP